MRTLRRVLSGVLLLPASVGAQHMTPRDTSAEATARTYLAALTEARWRDAARFLVLAPIDSERLQLVEMSRMAGPQRPRIPEDFITGDTSMPRAVAEWFAKQSDRYATVQHNFLSTLFANVRDTTELMRLSPVEAAARWLEARDRRYQYRTSMLLCGQVAVLPDSVARLLLPGHQVLGSVQHVDTAWVLHRDTSLMQRGTFDQSGPQVMTMIRVGNHWSIRPAEPSSTISLGVVCSPDGARDPVVPQDPARTRKPR